MLILKKKTLLALFKLFYFLFLERFYFTFFIFLLIKFLFKDNSTLPCYLKPISILLELQHLLLDIKRNIIFVCLLMYEYNCLLSFMKEWRDMQLIVRFYERKSHWLRNHLIIVNLYVWNCHWRERNWFSDGCYIW